MPFDLTSARRLTCTHGELRLSLHSCGVPGEFRVRVVSCPKDNPFERGLVIRPGTELRLCRGKQWGAWVTVRYFEPTIQYGRFCASGRLVVAVD